MIWRPFRWRSVSALLFMGLFSMVPAEIGLQAQNSPAQVQPAQAPPKATLDNGLLHVMLYLPDPVHGFYRGTRFDWAGVVGSLTYAGHAYYDPWFIGTDSSLTKDYNLTPNGIIASAATSITGPAEEFLKKEGSSGLGYAEAQPGETFVKIGVGTLRKPDDQKYMFYRPYEVVDHGKWTTKVHRDSVEFQQKLIDPKSGYGYLYTKIVRVTPHQPQMTIEHTLKNIGRLPIDTNVFCHNFLVLDHEESGPNYTIILPYTPKLERPIKDELGGIEGNHIFYRRNLKDGESFTVHTIGFDNTSKDNDIRVENTHVGAGVRVRGDHPLGSEELWSIRPTLAVEPYLHLSIAPGKSTSWSYTYDYYTLPKKD